MAERRESYVANVRLREIARSVRGTGAQSVLGVTIPAAVIVRLGWRVGDRLDLVVDNGRLVVQRVVARAVPYARP